MRLLKHQTFIVFLKDPDPYTGAAVVSGFRCGSGHCCYLGDGRIIMVCNGAGYFWVIGMVCLDWIFWGFFGEEA